MSWGMVAVAGASLVSGVVSSDAQRKAGNRAADAQSGAAQAGIDEQRRQFDAVQKLLAPYVTAGTGALSGQQDILGLNGGANQQSAIDAIRSSPQFTSLLRQGENSILSNASATGGLRGGNVQAALAEFSPALLAQLIDQQYSRLGGITSLGQNSAAMTGNAGLQTGNNIANLLGQQGAAQAGGFLSAGKATAGYANAFSNAVGSFAGMGGFGGMGGAGFTSPNAFGSYSNPIGETGNFRGTMLPGSLRGGG